MIEKYNDENILEYLYCANIFSLTGQKYMMPYYGISIDHIYQETKRLSSMSKKGQKHFFSRFKIDWPTLSVKRLVILDNRE
jgi:hypothetical protein